MHNWKKNYKFISIDCGEEAGEKELKWPLVSKRKNAREICKYYKKKKKLTIEYHESSLPQKTKFLDCFSSTKISVSSSCKCGD